MTLASEYTCPICGTDVQAASGTSKIACHECGYHIVEPEPEGGVRGYE